MFKSQATIWVIGLFCTQKNINLINKFSFIDCLMSECWSRDDFVLIKREDSDVELVIKYSSNGYRKIKKMVRLMEYDSETWCIENGWVHGVTGIFDEIRIFNRISLLLQ